MELTQDLASILETPTFDADACSALKEAAFCGAESLNRFLELLAGLERKASSGAPPVGAVLKLGVGYLLLGRADRAIPWLEKAPSSPLRAYHLGLAHQQKRRFKEAIAHFESAAELGWDKADACSRRVECLVLLGEFAAAQQLLAAQRDESSAHWLYAQARWLQEHGELEAAIEGLEKAIAIDPYHAEAMFHLAYLLDLHGSDARAMELYLKCSELPFVHIHALINLVVIHEDHAQYDKAAECLRRILVVDPNHPRARLYHKDIAAAKTMFIDELQLHAEEKRDAVLDIPVSDFELSVRSRNCLKKMNINTLGDLLRTTEADLLSYKNFGDTSLREIRAMLAQKGLALGQYANEKPPAAPPAPPAPDAGAPADILSRPVSSLELSVRSRKCLQRLGLNLVGDLVAKSEQELLESRNFGMTSLKEIKERLAELGLSLRQP